MEVPASTTSLPVTTSSSASSLLRSTAAWQSNPAVIGGLWMVSSSLLTTYSTTKFLKYEKKNADTVQRLLPWNQVPRPSLLTLYRFGGSLLLGLLAHVDVMNVRDRFLSTIHHVPAFLWPAMFLFLANFSNSLALNRIGISLTYTSKCGIPLITVLLTLAMDGSQALPGRYALLSLLPIACGIGMASWNAPTFEAIGFVCACVSATAQSALNVLSKKAIKKTGLAGPAAQRTMVAVGLCLTVVLNAYQFLGLSRRGEKSDSAKDAIQPPWDLTALAVVSYHVEYLLSFLFVQLVQPVTYGACDAVRRLSIILCGRKMFGGAPLSSLNQLGIFLALSGALCYSVATSR